MSSGMRRERHGRGKEHERLAALIGFLLGAFLVDFGKVGVEHFFELFFAGVEIVFHTFLVD